MDRYQNILKSLRQSWQQLRKLELTDSQLKDVFDFTIDILKELFFISPLPRSSQSQNSRTNGLNNIKQTSVVDEPMTITEASELININKGTISRKINEGVIPSYGQNRFKRIYKSDVLLLDRHMDELKEKKAKRKDNVESNKLAKRLPQKH